MLSVYYLIPFIIIEFTLQAIRSFGGFITFLYNNRLKTIK